MFKQVTVALVTILGSIAGVAYGDNAALPTALGVNLIAPHQEGFWSFGVQANYFEPNNDFNYALGQQQTTSGITSNNLVKTYAVGSDYDWGWGVDVTYHFPGEGRDVTLAFTQLNTSDGNSVDINDEGLTSLSAAGLSFIGKGFALAGDYDTASGHVNTNYDAVDLTFGQVITAGSRITLHPFAGLRYAYIDYRARGNYSTYINDGGGGGGGGGGRVNGVSADEEDLTTLATQTLKSNFQGVGPRLGSDAAVNLGSGFSLHGTLGVSLLVGSMDVDTDYSTANYTSNVLTSSNEVAHSTDTNTRVVPEADAKLSAMYYRNFNNGYGLGFEAGWQITNYFNAIQNTLLSTVDTSTQYTDFFMQGPYIGIQLDAA